MEEIKKRVLEMGEKRIRNIYIVLFALAAFFAFILPQVSITVGLSRSAGMNATDYSWLFIANRGFAGLLLIASALFPIACVIVTAVKKRINVTLTYICGIVVVLAGLVYLFSSKMTIGVGWFLVVLAVADACLLTYWTATPNDKK